MLVKDGTMRKDDRDPLPPHLEARLRRLEAMPDEEIDFSDIPETTDFSRAVRSADMKPVARVILSEPVTQLLEAAAVLEAKYPGRSFLPDGFQGGALADVIAADALGLALPAPHAPGVDGIVGIGGRTQVRLCIRGVVDVAPDTERLIVLWIVSPQVVEIVYDGPGQLAWAEGRPSDDGQRVVSMHKLLYLNALAAKKARQDAMMVSRPATSG